MRLKRRCSLASSCVVRILQSETLTGWIPTPIHRGGGARWKYQCPVLMWRRLTWFRGPCKCVLECDEDCRWPIQGELGGNILLFFFPCRSLSHWPFANDIGPLDFIMLIATILRFYLSACILLPQRYIHFALARFQFLAARWLTALTLIRIWRG
jgi:hypothetical protein